MVQLWYWWQLRTFPPKPLAHLGSIGTSGCEKQILVLQISSTHQRTFYLAYILPFFLAFCLVLSGFYLTFYVYMSGILSGIWHFVWRFIWHAFWYLRWYSNWPILTYCIFWHSIAHSIGHSIWFATVLITWHLTYNLTFYLAFFLKFYGGHLRHSFWQPDVSDIPCCERVGAHLERDPRPWLGTTHSPKTQTKTRPNFLDFVWLVVSTPLKNISQWEGLSHIYPYIMENKKCLKPPTRYSVDEL